MGVLQQWPGCQTSTGFGSGGLSSRPGSSLTGCDICCLGPSFLTVIGLCPEKTTDKGRCVHCPLVLPATRPSHLLHDGLLRVLALHNAGLHEVAHRVVTLAARQDGEAGRGAGVLQPLLDATEGLQGAGRKGVRDRLGDHSQQQPCNIFTPYTCSRRT